MGVVAYILIYANYIIEVFSPRNLDQECPRLTKQIPKTRIILLVVLYGDVLQCSSIL